jgi:sugar/nucleoside kinase (ribokinase family)
LPARRGICGGAALLVDFRATPRLDSRLTGNGGLLAVNASQTDVVVAGHICLDIIPGLSAAVGSPADLFRPGKLVKVGPAVVSTGGAVPNTGLALRRLGAAVRLMGKVGDDLLGNAILDVLRRHDPRLAEDMIVTAGENSSYSVVISPPGLDRTFLHCPGANDTFTAEDLPLARVAGTRIFHFGYPPLMHQMYADGGVGLARLLGGVRGQGAAVSLDMSRPDVTSEAGRADWPGLLRRALPHVDLFLPSLDETLLMLERETFLRLERDVGPAAMAAHADGKMLGRLAERLLEMGPAVVILKLGDQGLYLRTTGQAVRLAAVGGGLNLDAAAWCDRELLAPCFDVVVAGTTGSGDATIAGFLAALLHGLRPEEALRTAVGVGACSVEQADATSGVPTWTAVQQRLAAGWRQRPVVLALPGWRFDAQRGLWHGPGDRT